MSLDISPGKRPRQKFGYEPLDSLLGGGLLPGTLTVIAGATGAGKTQLGLSWAHQGLKADGHLGSIMDLTSRGDSQNHAGYLADRYGLDLSVFAGNIPSHLSQVFDRNLAWGDYFHPFYRAGKRVTRNDLDADDWHNWKVELGRTLRLAGFFLYGSMIRGSRRIMVDGVEPTDKFSESIQFEFFEYVYHQILRRDHDWAARELLREQFLKNLSNVNSQGYEQNQVGCLYLYTTQHKFVEELIDQPITEGDIFANANTILLMGRTREPGRLGRALCVIKHRGSACGDEIVPYRITDEGFVFGA
ncbi:MAG: recombinase RecA [Planctomycetota bacterium]|nr:recombinase RecA [Planctomycetota bacterium]